MLNEKLKLKIFDWIQTNFDKLWNCEKLFFTNTRKTIREILFYTIKNWRKVNRIQEIKNS